jgi:hypothetical protein
LPGRVSPSSACSVHPKSAPVRLGLETIETVTDFRPFVDQPLPR